MMDESNFLKVAKEAVLQAGKIIALYKGKVHKKNIKFGDNSDFCTEADLEAEAIITKIIRKNFPEHSLIAEEEGEINTNSEYTWVIDPLDGTFSFEHQIPFFNVSIGLLKNNQPILGVVYRVSTNDLYWAETGKGAFLNNKEIHVTDIALLGEAATVVDIGHMQKRLPKMDLYIKPMITNAGYIYSFGSAVLSLVFVGEGMIDASVSQAWIWDFAAATVIVKEAGGKITDLNGKDLDWTQKRLSVVASNGIIHDQVISILQK